MKRTLSSLFILVVLFSGLASGHSNVIYDVNLDFDEELKQGAVDSAQEFYDVYEEPMQFDFDRERIIVKFDRPLEYSVTISPIDYAVIGYRDDSLLDKKGTITFSSDQRKEIAEGILDALPEAYRTELVYGDEKKTYLGSFTYSWYRHVDGILVSGEELEVEVDPADGDVVAWQVSLFKYPESQMKTVPAITHQVAQQISLIRFSAEPTDFDPVLIIDRGKPVWITKVKSIYPHFVGVDALDGEVLYSGSLRGEMPQDYDYGRELDVVASSFINDIYQG